MKFSQRSLCSTFPTTHKLFQNPINNSIKKKTNQIVCFVLFCVWMKKIETKKQKTKNKKERKDTGRCWGCFFQHICINSTSFWGQFEGISGVNPLSLYSKIKNDQNEKFVKWKVKERELKQTNKQTHRMRIATWFGSMSVWGSHWETIS
jgi:hypothetical protein